MMVIIKAFLKNPEILMINLFIVNKNITDKVVIIKDLQSKISINQINKNKKTFLIIQKILMKKKIFLIMIFLIKKIVVVITINIMKMKI